MSLISFSSYSQTALLGDVNQDGKVTVSDVMMVVNIIMKGYTPFSVSQTVVTIPAGGSATIDIEGGYNQYEVTSSNTDVVNASLNGSTITLTAIASGETKVIVMDVLTKRYVEIFVTVENSPSQSCLTCPDDHHPHLIDLGLPSGTKWACCNVDTDYPEKQSPTNYGGYYAWGETETKNVYTEVTYLYASGDQFLGSDIAGTEYDVAHVKWGGYWQMPTSEQLEELFLNCNYSWTTINGINGGMFSGKNGNCIFLPASGVGADLGIQSIGEYGLYWSSDSRKVNYDVIIDYVLYFSDKYIDKDYYSGRFYGSPVRPVVIN